jgi:hypothetical protein
MNMKRGLVFSLCALALAAYGSSAIAQTVDLSLNLRYTDPADPTEGGTFQLVGKVNNPGTSKGIAAVNAYLSNVNTAGLAYAAGGNSITNAGAVYSTAVTGGTNLLYGQDTSAGTVVLNIGQGAGTVLANDPLRNAAWNGSTVLITGTFGGTRPAFITVGSNTTDANLFTATATTTTPEATGAVVDANTTMVVRGDSLASLGLNSNPAAGIAAGDVNRDGSVNVLDFNILANNFGKNAGTNGWDQGDTNDDGNVNVTDFNAMANNFGKPSGSPPAPVTAIPEPTALALFGLGMATVGIVRRRRS